MSAERHFRPTSRWTIAEVAPTTVIFTEAADGVEQSEHNAKTEALLVTGVVDAVTNERFRNRDQVMNLQIYYRAKPF